MQYKRDKQGEIIRDSDGNAIPIKTLNDMLEKRENEKAHFNLIIGQYIEKGYTFVQSNRGVRSAVFYHHANNAFQDDIVFCDIQFDKNHQPVDFRIKISREALLKIADEIRDVPSNKEERGEE